MALATAMAGHILMDGVSECLTSFKSPRGREILNEQLKEEKVMPPLPPEFGFISRSEERRVRSILTAKPSEQLKVISDNPDDKPVTKLARHILADRMEAIEKVGSE